MFRQLSWLKALIQKPWARGRSWYCGKRSILEEFDKNKIRWKCPKWIVGWAKRQNTTKPLRCWSCADGMFSLQVSQCRGEMNFAQHTMALNKFVLQSFATAIIWTTSFLKFQIEHGFPSASFHYEHFYRIWIWTKRVAWLPPIITIILSQFSARTF